MLLLFPGSALVSRARTDQAQLEAGVDVALSALEADR